MRHKRCARRVLWLIISSGARRIYGMDAPTTQKHPNSLANLRAPWKVGDNPNPAGRKKGVVYPVEHLRQHADRSADELAAIRDDESLSVSERAAARLALSMLVGSSNDTRASFEAVSDRLTGRPTQSVQVTQAVVTDPQSVLDDLRARYPQRLPPGATPSLPDT